MKKILLACIVIFFLSGCQGSSPLEDYGDTVLESYERVEILADKTSLQEVKKSIQSYRAINGKYPGSLEEVADSMGGTFNVEKYNYDPATGKIYFK